MPDINAYGAGLKDGKIKVAAGTIYDIDAIISAEGDPQQDEIQVKGDDEVKATFVTGVSENLTIVANAISFDVLQAITGNSYTSSPSGIEIPLGTDSEENPPFVEVQGFTQAKQADGTVATIKKIWHKVQIFSIKTSQAGEQEFNIELQARAYQTDETIVGASISNRVATLQVLNN